MLSDIAQAKTVLPDEDLQFLYQLEAILVAKTREPINAMQQQGQLPMPNQMPPDMGMGMPPDMGMSGMPGGTPMPVGPPGGVSSGGVVPLAAAPNPDELRRLLQVG
jgi:hypothetical protein